MHEELQCLLTEEKLPQSYADQIDQYLIPLSEVIVNKFELHNKSTFIVGVNGAQGTGKTTLSKVLSMLLTEQQLNIVTFSLDDFYLTQQERKKLAITTHPLLRTRGVPGTHDILLLQNTLKNLVGASSKEEVTIPRFDKAIDDRYPKEQWHRITGPIDMIIIEGWCVAAPPQDEQLLNQSISDWERQQDPDGAWRHYVNRCLQQQYAQIFSQLDFTVFMKAPSFEQVFEWRCLQEQKLAEKRSDGNSLMNNQEIKEFISHYERLTKHCLDVLPQQCSALLSLDTNHAIKNMHIA